MHFCRVGLVFCFVFFKNLSKNKSMIWIHSVFCFQLRSFFFLVCFNVMLLIPLYLPLLCACVFVLFFNSIFEAVGFAGPRLALQGEELLPYLTLRRCWKQRLKKKDSKEERSYHSESVCSGERPVRQDKKKQKLWLRIIFFPFCMWSRSIPGGVFIRLLWESDCDLVVTLWSHNGRKYWGGVKMRNPTILAN